MTDFTKRLRPSLAGIEAYHLKDLPFEVKLNQNESPYDLPLPFKQKLAQEFADLNWNRYPSFTTTSLREQLAVSLEVSEESLIIGNGSNELLQLVINLVLPPDGSILIVTPTFAIYQHLIHIAGLNLIELSLDENFDFPIDKIVAVLDTEKIDLCILCSPNSPTGGIISEQDLGRILEQATGLVLLDEAYHEFGGMNYLGLQKVHHNLIVTRTFSKAIGLAGLRIGYLTGRVDIVREINKAKLPYNVNIFSEFVAARVLQDPDLIRSNVQAIVAEKVRLRQKLTEMETLRVYPSRANFFMIESAMPADELFERLAESGILIRNISKYHPMLANKLRITVGSPSDNDRLIQSLHHVLG